MLKHVFSCQDLSPATDTVNGTDNAGCKLTRVWAQESGAATYEREDYQGKHKSEAKCQFLSSQNCSALCFASQEAKSAH